MKPKTCLDCSASIPRVPGKKPEARCVTCHRVYKKLSARARRLKKNKELLSAGEVSGRKICSNCFQSKLLSVFSTTRTGGKGKSHKMCDTCLTRVYASPSRIKSGFTADYWRRRAYTCNTAARATQASYLGLKPSQVSLSQLSWVCKPQHLSGLFEKQKGNCYFCVSPLIPEITSVDHLTPRSRGGSNSLRNLRLVCGDCNRLKHTRTEVEFRAFVKDFIKRFQVTELVDKEP